MIRSLRDWKFLILLLVVIGGFAWYAFHSHKTDQEVILDWVDSWIDKRIASSELVILNAARSTNDAGQIFAFLSARGSPSEATIPMRTVKYFGDFSSDSRSWLTHLRPFEFEKLDVAKFASRTEQLSRGASGGNFIVPYDSLDFVVLGYFASKKGYDKEANALIQLAIDHEAGPGYSWSYTPRATPVPPLIPGIATSLAQPTPAQLLLEHLKDELYEPRFNDAARAFKDVSQPWPKVRQAFENAAEFGSAQNHEADDIVRSIRKMEKDASRHPKVNLADLKGADLIRELIYRLPDDTGYAMPEPFPTKADSISGKLVAIGEPAVPFLIDAIIDDRPCRGPDDPFLASGCFSRPTIYPVGTRALRCLGSILGHSFDMPYVGSSQADFAAVQARVSAWWVKQQRIGELAMLVDEVGRGGDAGAQEANRLSERYPQAASGPLELGITRLTNPDYAGNFVEPLRKLNLEEGRAFLRSQLKRGASLQLRLACAQAICDREPDLAVRAMSHELDIAIHDEDQSEVESCLVEFLATSGRKEAVQALERKLNSSPRFRPLIVENFPTFGQRPETGDPQMPQAVGQEHVQFRSAIEGLYASALALEDIYNGPYIGQDRPNRRICDIASRWLAIKWPDKYRFKRDGTLSQLESDRAHNQRLWRESHASPQITSAQ